MNKQQEDIKAIREMMEKSSKILSLSGLSGISAGITALLGATVAYFYLWQYTSSNQNIKPDEILFLLADATVVLIISVSLGIYFSWRKAKKRNLKASAQIIKTTLYNLGIPLIAGGILALIFLFRGDIGMVIATTLLFYGLALVNVSKYTFDEIHYLGLTEIILGIAAVLFLRYGIIFWAIGFGFCHILYGLSLYVKYDAKKE